MKRLFAGGFPSTAGEPSDWLTATPDWSTRGRSNSHHELIFEPLPTDEQRVRCASTSAFDRKSSRPTSPAPAPTMTSSTRAQNASAVSAPIPCNRSAAGSALVPLHVELHPPSSCDDAFGPPFRLVVNASHLNAQSQQQQQQQQSCSLQLSTAHGSAGNVSAKSAPASPHADWTPPVSPTPPRSPSTSASARADRHEAKQQQDANQHPPRGGSSKSAPLSSSLPSSSASLTPSPGRPGDGSTLAPPSTPTPDEPPGSSKSRQKKFHRHFKQVAQDERVLNYYSCALVADILLQGQLYITKNYFAFYSNVFGYVTKLLIPTASVLRISKEKTARIIPNAVGVVTGDEKHVFGSLLSRDATYRLMTTVWKSAVLPAPPAIQLHDDEVVGLVDLHHEGYESSLSGSERSCGALTPAPSEQTLHAVLSKVEAATRSSLPSDPTPAPVTRNPRPAGALLAAGTALLACLFLSAGFLLYRISLVQSRFNDSPLLSGSDHVYQEILKWQAQLHSRSANEVQDFLTSNLDQLAKVRQSLEALSQLLLSNEATARDQRPNS